MTSAYILIVVVLFLGGIIAALGDRLGSKIGKARLQLFNLRPRKTAMVITILTGISIAATTLGSLFAFSESLRRGVFELDDILKDRRQLEAEVAQISQAKIEAEKALATAQTEQRTVEQRLKMINQDFRDAQTQLKTVSKQASTLRQEIQSLLDERKKLSQQRDQLQTDLGQREQQIALRDQVLERLNQEQGQLQAEIARRDQSITQLDQAIASKDRDLQAKATQLETTEGQLTFLRREVEILEEYYRTYQDLREREIALVRGQVLSIGIVQVLAPDAAIEAADELLRQANRKAIQATNPEDKTQDGRLVKITKIQVQQLLQKIRDGREYVVRIISAGNYVQGEPEVRVFADVTLNQQIFSNGEAVSAVSIERTNLTEAEIQERLDLLLAAAQFRARSAGVIGTIQVGDGRIKTLLDFIERLKETDTKIEEIQAIASERTYTAGPLKLQLIAISKGEEVLRS